jgi:hypothetical protein
LVEHLAGSRPPGCHFGIRPATSGQGASPRPPQHSCMPPPRRSSPPHRRSDRRRGEDRKWPPGHHTATLSHRPPLPTPNGRGVSPDTAPNTPTGQRATGSSQLAVALAARPSSPRFTPAPYLASQAAAARHRAVASRRSRARTLPRPREP